MRKLEYYFENITAEQLAARLTAGLDRDIVVKLYGKDKSQVLIYRKPIGRNSFRPEFYGKIEDVENGAKMSGTLGAPVWATVFLILAFSGMWIIHILLFIAELISSGDLKSMALFTVFLTFFTVLFGLIATVFQRGSIKYIKRFIEKMGGKLR